MSNTIFLVGGGKGGVGKSLMSIALLDFLHTTGQRPFLVETDTSVPDVFKTYAKAVAGELVMRDDDRLIDDDETTLVFTPRPRAPAVRPPEPTQDRLWDANDVARYLKVSRSWVYHRAEAGLLPLRRVGGLLRFDPAAIRAFAAGKPVDDNSRREPRRDRKADSK